MDGGRLPLEEWFWDMPVCTRWWTTATLLTSALVQCRVVTPFQLFYSFRAVFVKSQVCTAQAPFTSELTNNHLSTGAYLRPFFISVPSRSISSSRYISYSDTLDYWKSRPADHLHTSLGYSHMP